METVNGRLGFQYRQIVWDDGEATARSVRPERRLCSFAVSNASRGASIASPGRGVGHPRQAFSVRARDRSGRRDFPERVPWLDSFVVPQLRRMSPNVFYAEIWDGPIHQIREALEREAKIPPGRSGRYGLYVQESCCPEGRCFLVIDGCERLKRSLKTRWRSSERLVEFCLENEACVPYRPRGQRGVPRLVQAFQEDEPLGRCTSWVAIYGQRCPQAHQRRGDWDCSRP